MRRTTGIKAKMSGKTKTMISRRLRPWDDLFNSMVRWEGGGRAWLDMARWMLVGRGRSETEVVLDRPGRSMEGLRGGEEEVLRGGGGAGPGAWGLRWLGAGGSSIEEVDAAAGDL